MQDYPSIAEHGPFRDLQTGARATTEGSIDWYCCPRVGSARMFRSLLDGHKGGHFRTGPVDEDYTTAFTHLALVDAAITLDSALDAKVRFHPATPQGLAGSGQSGFDEAVDVPTGPGARDAE